MCPQRPSPDVKAELFELLFRTLHHNWRYFFKSTVLASVQRGLAEEPMENEPQFSAIMQVPYVAELGVPAEPGPDAPRSGHRLGRPTVVLGLLLGHMVPFFLKWPLRQGQSPKPCSLRAEAQPPSQFRGAE